YQQYKDNIPDGQTLWDELSGSILFENNADREALINKIKLVFQVSVLVQDHVPLVEQIVNINNITELKDLATYSEDDWHSMIDLESVGIPNIENPGEPQKDEYVTAVIRAVEKAFPTATFLRYLITYNNDSYDEIVTILQANPNYEIGEDDPIAAYNATTGLNANGKALTLLLKIKRLWYLTEHYDKYQLIDRMLSDEIHSAFQISGMGRERFLNDFSADLEDPEFTFEMAIKRASAVTSLYGAYSTGINSLQTQAFDSTAISESAIAQRSDFDKEVLGAFIADDFCSCRSCQSSLSPAAYLLDTIKYLDGARLLSSQTEGDSAWQKLLERRPELAKILASCDNTNVLIPYIDLTIEVLENAVLSDVSRNENRQTTAPQEALQLMPQYLEPAAYDLLQQAVYPIILPFHYANHQADSYLEALKLNRADFTKAISNTNSYQYTTTLSEAWLGLGISETLYSLLTDNDKFAEYYNVPNDLNQDDPFIHTVSNLLLKTGLSYEHLSDILKSRYVNPSAISVTFDGIDCELDKAKLPWTEAEYIKLHKFIRLQSLTGLAVPTLDRFLLAATTNNQIDDNTLIALYDLHVIAKRLNAPIDKVIHFIAPLDEYVYDSDVSSFEEAFPGLLSEATRLGDGNLPVFTTDGVLHEINGSLLLNGLLFSTEELLTLVKDLPGGTISPDQIGNLYRLSLFLRYARMSLSEYRTWLDLMDTVDQDNDVKEIPISIDSPDLYAGFSQSALKFLSRVDIVTTHFSIDEWLLITKGESDINLTRETLDAQADFIYRQLTEKLAEKGISTAQTDENLLNIWVFLTNEEVGARSMSIINGDTSAFSGENSAATTAAVEDFVSTYWQELVPGDAVSYFNALDTDNPDYSAIIRDLYQQSLVDKLQLSEIVVQAFTEFYNLDFERTEEILLTEKQNSVSGLANDLAYYLHEGFVFLEPVVDPGDPEADPAVALPYSDSAEIMVNYHRNAVWVAGLGLSVRHIVPVKNGSLPGTAAINFSTD
ncbi:MAG: Tc toxin subunit A, partial [Cyclobacteriaceae bacterium]